VVLGALFAEETSVSWYDLGLRTELVGELEILGGRGNYRIVGDFGWLIAPFHTPLALLFR
jgi:hypothetical protein